MEDKIMTTAKSILTLVFLVGLFLIGPVSSTYGERKALLPAIGEGTVWQFKSFTTWPLRVSSISERNGDYELIYQNRKLKVFSLNRDERAEIEDTRAEELKRMIALEHSERQYLHFPLSIGKRWNVAYPVRLPGGGFTMQRNIGYVKGIENIQTAIGTFEVFRIDGWISGNAWIDGTYSGPYALFYSPETASVIKLVYENKSNGTGSGPRREIELIKLGLPK
jgi:hypothetical protein